jgi:hypothetical protein
MIEIAREVFGPITEIEERVYLLDEPPKYPLVACKEASERITAGFWFSHSGCQYHQRGRRLTYFLHPERLRDLLVARSVAEELLGDPVGWSFTKINNALLEWACPSTPGGHSLEEWILPPPDWGFGAFLPGKHGWRRLVDIESAYHQLLRRLPSPRVSWQEGERSPTWWGLVGDCGRRWNTLLDVTEQHKPFRLTLHGTMLGSLQPQPYYRQGELLYRPGTRGRYRRPAALVARSLYELVGLEARRLETEFAATDCLLLKEGDRPELWDRIGIKWTVRDEGETVVRAPGCYRVGKKKTADFDGTPDWPANASADRYSALPRRLLYRQWLG